MRKVFLLICVSISLTASAQFLSLKDLIKLQSKNLTEAQEYLAKNEWKFSNANEERNKFNIISFAYERNKVDLKKAQGWLRYIYNEEKGIVRIKYEIYKSEEFNDLLSETKRKGFKLQNSKIKKGKLIDIYGNDNYYLFFESIKIENPVSASVRYMITLRTAADYLNTKEKQNED